MATKSYRFPITVGVADAALGSPEVRDSDGRLVRPASLGIRHIPSGNVVEMDEVEAASIFALHGPYKRVTTTVEGEVIATPVQVNKAPARP